MAKNPIINDDAFFAAIDPNVGALAIRKPQGEFPWQGVAEDRETAHIALGASYAKLRYPKPRFNWARSPYAMFGAMQYLRQMQTQQRQVVVRELMRSEDALEAEVRATFLEGILERDLTVSLGACLSSTIMPGYDSPPKCLDQLHHVLRRQFQPPATGKPLVAGWSDWVLYPMSRPFNYALRTQALCIFPFLRCAWLCRPPVTLETDEDGNLLYARFEDGFEVTRKAEEKQPRLEGDGKILALPEETK